MDSPQPPTKATVAEAPDKLPALVRWLREYAGYTHADLAADVGVGARTPPTWETDDPWGRIVPTSVLDRLIDLAPVDDADGMRAHALRVHGACRRAGVSEGAA